MPNRKPYPTDVGGVEWPSSTPISRWSVRTPPERIHDLREVFNALRWIVRVGAPWRMMPNDFPPWEAVYQQAQR
jgi:transposase